MLAPRDSESHFQLTRELELLISGALVFALLQLPDLLDGWWLSRQVHLDGIAFAFPFGVYYVAKLASYGLIVTITLHFLLRGFWVAILGLRSAYPDGIDEDNIQHGALLKEFYAKRLLSLDELEDRIDRIAALLFSFIFLFLGLLLTVSLWAAFGGAVALAAARLTGSDSLVWPTFWGIFFSYVVLQSAVATADRHSKKKELSPRTKSIVMRLLLFSHYATLNFLYAPVQLTLTTRLSRKTVTILQIAFLYTLIGFFAIGVFSSAGILGFDSYRWFPPNAGREQVRTSNYESLRSGPMQSASPTIQSDILTEPYIRLFVPYEVKRDNDLIRELCPEVKPFRADGVFLRPRGKTDPAASRAVLRCFEKIYTIALDGKPLAKLDASFYVHPESGVHGRLIMIPAHGLAAGRHELTVQRQKRESDEERRTPTEFSIPFWK